MIKSKIALGSTHPSANAATFSHKRRHTDFELLTIALDKAKDYAFHQSTVKSNA
jgi:hypothetical protein